MRYEQLSKERKAIDTALQIEILNEAAFIGMTTTGLIIKFFFFEKKRCRCCDG